MGPEQRVVEKDIDDDRSEHGEGQGDEAAYQKEQAGDDHDDAYEGHPSMCRHNAKPGEGVAGGIGHGKEMKDVVEAEDEEDEAE